MKRIICFVFAFLVIFYAVPITVYANDVLNENPYLEIKDMFDYDSVDISPVYYNFKFKKCEDKISAHYEESPHALLACAYNMNKEAREQYTEEYAAAMGEGYILSDFSLDRLDDYTKNGPEGAFFVYVKKDRYFFVYQFGDDVPEYQHPTKYTRIKYLMFNIGYYTFTFSNFDKTEYDYVTQSADETINIIKKLEKLVNEKSNHNSPSQAKDALNEDPYIEIKDIFDYDSVSMGNDILYTCKIKKRADIINNENYDDVSNDEYAELRYYYKSNRIHQPTEENVLSTHPERTIFTDFSLEQLDDYTKNSNDGTSAPCIKKDGCFFQYFLKSERSEDGVEKKFTRIQSLRFKIGDYLFELEDFDQTKYDHVTRSADESIKIIKMLEKIVNNKNKDNATVIIIASAIALVLVAGVAVTFVVKNKKKRATVTEYPTTEV